MDINFKCLGPFFPRVRDNKIFVNGKDVTPDSKEIKVTVKGNVNRLECGSCSTITVNGDVKDVSSASGDIDITGNVTGQASTMSGDVTVRGSVNGGVKTMSGDIRR